MMRKRMNAEKRSESILDTIGASLDLPDDTLSGCAHIEMYSNKEIIIEGCRGVLNYSEKNISVNTGKMSVCVCGCDMTIKSMQEGIAVIRGTICSVGFEN